MYRITNLLKPLLLASAVTLVSASALASPHEIAEIISDKGSFEAESTFGESSQNSSFPYKIVIDLGDEYNIAGLQYLPRMESDTPGAIKDFRMYVKKTEYNYITD